MRNRFLIFLIVFSFLQYKNVNVIFALQIKNVNYSASNNNDRWIEVFNDGSDILDFTISDYKILDSKDTTKHGISILQGDATFPANTSIFISPSTSTPDGANKIFKSSYSIDKTNGYISIINSDNSNTYFCFNYGNVSCPGSTLIDNSTSTNSTSTNATSTNVDSDSDTKIIYVYIPTNNQNKYGDISLLLPVEKTVPAGGDSEFSIKALDQNKKAISGLDFEWSFGDGGGKFGQKVSHYYVYPGEYTLVVSADGYTVGGEAKMNVKVVAPDISISKVGMGGKENFIDLTNNTDYDLVLSNFYIDLDNTFYKLPKNFTLAKRKTVHISGEALGFNLPAKNISLNYPNKFSLTTYSLNSNLVFTTSILDSLNLDNAIKNEKINIDKVNLITEKDDLDSKEENKRINQNDSISQISINSKEIKLSNTKEANESIMLKRLIISNENNKYLNENKKENLNKDKTVDTGIADWLKSLIY
ncbi:MAG: hypothetical protein KBD12_02795 [Candidatus Pacebacteria bacterium]|nr:hypothetical protein [Candidatus Paceibacterota bacterium]